MAGVSLAPATLVCCVLCAGFCVYIISESPNAVKNGKCNLVGWHIVAIPALKRERQEDWKVKVGQNAKFETILSCTRLSQTITTMNGNAE